MLVKLSNKLDLFTEIVCIFKHQVFQIWVYESFYFVWDFLNV